MSQDGLGGSQVTQGDVWLLGVTQGAPGRSSATARSGSLMASAPRRRPNLCPTETSPASLPVRGAYAVGPFVFRGPCEFTLISLGRCGDTFAEFRSA